MPSGVMATHRTFLALAGTAKISRPVATSQRRIVVSPPVSRWRPPGENAAAHRGGMAVDASNFFATDHAPQAHRAILAGGCHMETIGRKRHAVDLVGVSFKTMDFATRLNVPQSHGFVQTY